METNICSVLAVFPVPDMERTARYYCDVLGFRAVPYLTVQEPHVCLYRDQVEIVLTGANRGRIFPHRELYGYGEDAYLVVRDQEALEAEFREKGAKIVRPLQLTDYNNREFVLEDIDGRWLAFGMKQR